MLPRDPVLPLGEEARTIAVPDDSQVPEESQRSWDDADAQREGRS